MKTAIIRLEEIIQWFPMEIDPATEMKLASGSFGLELEDDETIHSVTIANMPLTVQAEYTQTDGEKVTVPWRGAAFQIAIVSEHDGSMEENSELENRLTPELDSGMITIAAAAARKRANSRGRIQMP